MTSNLPPIEPAADQRQFGLILRQQFLALTEQGFTEDQALRLLGYMLAAHGGAS